MDTYHFEYCPKRGCYHPHLVKSGFANSGKQMLRCKECGKRFVIDHDQLTFRIMKPGRKVFWLI